MNFCRDHDLREQAEVFFFSFWAWLLVVLVGSVGHAVSFDSPAARECRNPNSNPWNEQVVINQLEDACQGELGPERAEYENMQGVLRGIDPTQLEAAARQVQAVNESRLIYAEASRRYCDQGYRSYLHYCVGVGGSPEPLAQDLYRRGIERWDEEIAAAQAYTAENQAFVAAIADGASTEEQQQMAGAMAEWWESGDYNVPNSWAGRTITSALEVLPLKADALLIGVTSGPISSAEGAMGLSIPDFRSGVGSVQNPARVGFGIDSGLHYGEIHTDPGSVIEGWYQNPNLTGDGGGDNLSYDPFSSGEARAAPDTVPVIQEDPLGDLDGGN